MDGELAGIRLDYKTNKPVVEFFIDDRPADVQTWAKDLEGKRLEITAKPLRGHRSKDANALFWACCGEIAESLHRDKWGVYLRQLRDYGKFTCISIPKESLEDIKRVWREVEIVGEDDDSYTLLCYYGSSTYNSKEFSVLLSGTIYEMKELGLTPPPTREVREAIEALERREKSGKHNGV